METGEQRESRQVTQGDPGPRTSPAGVWKGADPCEGVVNGICHCTKLSQVELRLHNPGIERTGSGIKGHPKASHKNPGHHGSLGPQGDLKAVSNTEMHIEKSTEGLSPGLRTT